MKQDRVTLKANHASFVREWATNQTERQRLKIQVSGLVTKDAFTNTAKQLRARRIAECLVKGYSQHLGRNEHHHAYLQAC